MSWTITVTVTDDKAAKRTIKLYRQDSDWWDINLWAYEYVQTLDKVIDGQIVGVNITRALDVEPAAALASSNVKKKARFVFKTHDASIYRHEIPTFNEIYTIAIRYTEKRRMNRTDPAVLALETLMIDAQSVGHPYTACDSRGAELFTVQKGTEYVWRGKMKS